MSLHRTYALASTARAKLGREAGKADHDLRLLVGSANLLDGLMLELQQVEREEEAWFNASIKRTSKPEEPRHVQWIDTISEDEQEQESDDEEDEEDEDSSDDEEDEEMFKIPLRKMRSPPVLFSSEEMEIDEDDEFDDDLALTRVISQHSPPELMQDYDSDEEDDSMPPSPEQASLEYTDKEREAIATSSFYSSKSQEGMEDFIMHPAQPQLIASY